MSDERRGTSADALRSIAQLDMLHHLAADLNAGTSVEEIGEAITQELRTIIDYHNCRVYVLLDDGTSLHPIAFRGELFSEYEHEDLEDLAVQVGEGITGHVAATQTSLITPDAREVEFAAQIPGTDDILESMLAVPMLAGGTLVGVIVLSSLGYGMFDDEDRRMLEVLAPHAAIALQRASLLAAEREAAERSATLLRMSQAMTRLRSVDEILREAIQAVPTLVPCVAAAAYVLDTEAACYRPIAISEITAGATRPRPEVEDLPIEVARPYLLATTEPFVVEQEEVSKVPRRYQLTRRPGQVLIAPLRWETDGAGALALVGGPDELAFDDRSLQLARGIADIASLALRNARRMSELERFEELVASLDAVFWEADARDLVVAFIAGRVRELLSDDPERWREMGRRWGEHVAEEDRAAAVAALRAAAHDADAASLEYRVPASNGDVLWIRDMVHVVKGPGGRSTLRGLMFDITERKRAEEALRRSEQQASSAFEREREAAQQLRALDEMKDTFLQAVSHDLRTPLTAILGSALTLEQSWPELERDDARDLVRLVAANARKLERLLSDLLDLDRLQRGIITPQRRPTGVRELVDRVVSELEHPHHSVTVDVADLTAPVDAAKVERIVENLLTNAIRHTPPGSNVWVRCVGSENGLLMVVEDDGPGIPESLRDEVFDSFRQAPGSTSGHSPGVGIGLSLVRRFAELHGGRSWVEERAGGGASFRVLLPYA